MPDSYLGLVTLVVREYDEAISFFCDVLGFTLLEDEYQPAQDKRWVVVAPSNAGLENSGCCALLLARAKNAEEAKHIGNQTGGRVGFFLYTNDFDRDYKLYKERDVAFIRDPKNESYGRVAVFEDLYGNLWDMLEKGYQQKIL